ncbi:HAMP domain-containing sensor histidine kinase [Schleiferia thermophila]|uniref:histidine kinase n=1 Tax=Schleiferia thermophila TaxID=884107 RepID=A0A369AAC3_9FLAO|nr:ATP-binding protein [Schleiferia thermophila]RCX05348.1 signal transduction histidine kinase [Schleiferia thermophila]GCD79146.1 two-component sensor histidine kinase [Schleiferia thermophila]
MKIKTRLTLWFTSITALILVLFAVSVLYSSAKIREREFFNYLTTEAITRCNLIFSAGLDPEVLQQIYKGSRKNLTEPEIAIYDLNHKLHYHDAPDIDVVKEDSLMLGEIQQKGYLRFYQGRWQVIGYLHRIENQEYLITAAAYDSYGHSTLNTLWKSMLLISVPSLILIFVSGIFLSRKALDPIREITDKAQKITATNLDLRLPQTNNRDELSSLIKTFNRMLQRLEDSFEAQKSFVYHLAHEIRTPLSAIIAEAEYLITKDRTSDAYKTGSQAILKDALTISKITSGLLDLARASYHVSQIQFKEVRVDEILLDAGQQVMDSNKCFRVEISYEIPSEHDGEQPLTISANEYLLRTAFSNLMDNACKFSSDNTCKVTISMIEDVIDQQPKIKITFADQGPGISPDDQEKLFQPFFRGKNKDLADGIGIGLSLTRRIIELHRAQLTLHSDPNGTVVHVVFSSQR